MEEKENVTGTKEVAEIHRRNAELGDAIFSTTTDVGGAQGSLHFVYSEEIRKKAEKLVSQSLDKLLSL